METELTVKELLELIKKPITVYSWVQLFEGSGEYIKITKTPLYDRLKTNDSWELKQETKAVLRNGSIYIN